MYRPRLSELRPGFRLDRPCQEYMFSISMNMQGTCWGKRRRSGVATTNAVCSFSHHILEKRSTAFISFLNLRKKRINPLVRKTFTDRLSSWRVLEPRYPCTFTASSSLFLPLSPLLSPIFFSRFFGLEFAHWISSDTCWPRAPSALSISLTGLRTRCVEETRMLHSQHPSLHPPETARRTACEAFAMGQLRQMCIFFVSMRLRRQSREEREKRD